MEEIIKTAVVVGDSWLFNKDVLSDTDDPPISLDIKINEFVIVFFTVNKG